MTVVSRQPGIGSPTVAARASGRALPRFRPGDAPVAVAVAILALLVVCALFAPYVAPYDPNEQDLLLRLKPPAWMANGSLQNPLGTDPLGRDILSRVIFGARISLLVGLSALLVSGAVGVAIGLVAGYYRGRVDDWLMRIADIQLAIPFVLLAIAILAIVGASTQNVILVLTLHGWVVYARLARGQTLSLREREFVQAYRALGARHWQIMVQHILPNLLSPVIVVASLEMASLITLEASLSFLGLGIQPPATSWGVMLADGRNYLSGGAWWVVTFPGLALTLAILSINLLADWLRDVLDPQLRI
jgi:peptide/nickel transport system permease protein